MNWNLGLNNHEGGQGDDDDDDKLRQLQQYLQSVGLNSNVPCSVDAVIVRQLLHSQTDGEDMAP